MVLATSQREDGVLDDGNYDPTDTAPSRSDSFEYVMYGKVYRIEGDEAAIDTSRLLVYKKMGRVGINHLLQIRLKFLSIDFRIPREPLFGSVNILNHYFKQLFHCLKQNMIVSVHILPSIYNLNSLNFNFFHNSDWNCHWQIQLQSWVDN